jgi:hypothetical protein
MPPPAYFGIESSGLSLVIDLLILFLVVVYASLIYWTYADARRRITDPMLIGCATAASLFPFVGTLVYMILRPPEYLEDVHERELEVRAAEARLHELDHSLCPHCDYRIERDFLRCPSCLRKLKERCASCSRPLDRSWTICPYCEADVPTARPARSTSRRARDVAGSSSSPSPSARAGRAPEPAAFAGESSTLRSEPAPAGGAEMTEEGGASEPALKPSARPRGAGRPRPST